MTNLEVFNRFNGWLPDGSNLHHEGHFLLGGQKGLFGCDQLLDEKDHLFLVDVREGLNQPLPRMRRGGRQT